MAGTERRRSRNWRFADAGSRFDTGSRAPERDKDPISPTFARKIVRCRRCGSRIVSNAKRCPYCSKSVTPFYRSFAFWLSVVISLALATVWLVFFYEPVTLASVAPEIRDPIVVGHPEKTDTANLPIGYTVECNDMMITVVDVNQNQTTSDNRVIYEFTVQFYNMSENEQSLLMTQWLLVNSDGVAEECYIGKNSEGAALTSGMEGRHLAPHESVNTRLYFTCDNPERLVYLINSLNAQDGPEISWQVSPY